ncbi:hypothetical protein [Comamonas terrigena]|uniref:hypothetical protein n=1 Tax=Comamonas terrigena TaxID=32013 RepID=UPI002449D0F7|nr:hypothetical protein [Comamonas terrigena]MDH1502603.1 hypothetical protein [Comamonas terrigena]
MVARASGVAYGFQRVHAALQTGHALTVQQQRQEPVRCFMQQSTLDGACGTHVIAMLAVILGLAKASAMHDMSRRKYGVPAEVWKAFGPTYFTGVHAKDWVELVNSLALPLKLTAKYGANEHVDQHALDWLMRGELVALAFASVQHQRTKHWALAVGVEGLVEGQRHQVQRILLLDPSAGEPVFRAFSARLSLPMTGFGSRRAKLLQQDKKPMHKVLFWLYESESWCPELVQLLAAVRVRRAP